MSTRRLWAIGWLGGLVALLVGVSGAIATDSSGGSAAGNLGAARAEAPRLLSLLRLPSDASSSAGEPAGDHGVLARPGYDEATPNLVDAYGWWTVPGSSPD